MPAQPQLGNCRASGAAAACRLRRAAAVQHLGGHWARLKRAEVGSRSTSTIRAPSVADRDRRAGRPDVPRLCAITTIPHWFRQAQRPESGPPPPSRKSSLVTKVTGHPRPRSAVEGKPVIGFRLSARGVPTRVVTDPGRSGNVADQRRRGPLGSPRSRSATGSRIRGPRSHRAARVASGSAQTLFSVARRPPVRRTGRTPTAATVPVHARPPSTRARVRKACAAVCCRRLRDLRRVTTSVNSGALA